jgi:predicted nuclease of predicted toxin-antitoxin system
MTGFYFDEHMNRLVADALVKRGYPVVMAVDVGMIGKDDDTEHLAYATEHNLVMVTFDHPFAGRTMSHSNHPALMVLAYSIRENIGRMVEVLAEFAELYDTEKDRGQVFWLSQDGVLVAWERDSSHAPHALAAVQQQTITRRDYQRMI